MVANYQGAYYDALAAQAANPLASGPPASPFTVSGCSPGGTPISPYPYNDAALMNFFRPGGLNPSIIGAYASVGDPTGCIPQAIATTMVQPQASTLPAVRKRTSAAAFPSATWTPITPTAAPSITASAPTSANASADTTSSSLPIPGRTPSTTPPICNRP